MTTASLDFDALRDSRHLDARAASDLADWLVSLEVAGKADRTINTYRLGIASLLRSNMTREAEEFTARDIELWLASVPRRSRAHARSICSQFFGYLEDQERIERSPMHKVVRIKKPARLAIDVFSEAECSLLIGLPAPHGLLFGVLLGSGVRREEAIRLTWRDIDLDRERLHVRHGKGDKPRIVPLLDFALASLSELELLERPAPDEHVFFCTTGPRTKLKYRPKHRRTEPLGSSSFARWYEDCIYAAGVKYRKPHTTRHTYADILRREGYDLEERQLLLGHESIRTTADIYGNLTIEDVARKMRGAES